MPPSQPLPLPTRFNTPDDYLESLLCFSTEPLFRTLCGGVHILDFFSRDPPNDLYRQILPTEWVAYFENVDTPAVLDLLIRTPLAEMDVHVPASLRRFVQEVREHSLRREFVRQRNGARQTQHDREMEWALHAGMKPKKVHEVSNFAAYVDDLVTDIDGRGAGVQGNESRCEGGITHILDYGSGQAYLSRTLAKKYAHHVVGIEGRENNVKAARDLDQRYDHLAEKRQISTRGSIQYVMKRVEDGNLRAVVEAINDDSTDDNTNDGSSKHRELEENSHAVEQNGCEDGECETVAQDGAARGPSVRSDSQPNCHLPSANQSSDKRLLLISLHSCGNLLHHALRAFVTTPEVRAVALIGCCYNLLTESLGPSFKPPYQHRTAHPRLVTTSVVDPCGFPISALYQRSGVSLNITARMMACQAPQNWTRTTSAAFFTRHYFRALLQRVLADRRFVREEGEPVILGSLRKACYASFEAYVEGAMAKLGWELGEGAGAREVAERYEEQFRGRRKEIEIVWSLMAFTAGVVESLIVVDRWVFLREALESRGSAWVEPVFEYGESPRNLVVVGVRDQAARELAGDH